MTYSGSNHFLKLLLSFCELIFEIVSPVSEKYHWAWVIIILNIYNIQSYNIGIF